MRHNVYLYIFVMAAVIFLIRVLPLTLIRRKIQNKTLRSFLYYVPYVTLAVMTFPAILDATNSVWSGLAALIAGVLLAYFGVSLFCHAFPTYEDALYLWESRKQTNVAARILLFVPMVCMRAGAFLARFGVWQLLAIAGAVVWILYLVGVL